MISRQKNAFTLATGLGLNYECLRLSLVELLFKAFHVGGQVPSLRKEHIVLWEVLGHRHEVLSEQVLPCQRIDTWEVICSLVSMHLDQKCRHGRAVDKPDVPVIIFINGGTQVQRLCHFMDQLILRIGYVNAQLCFIIIVAFA